MPFDVDIFGEGIYTPRQAARLIHGTSQEVLRWTRGSGPNGPLWSAHYSELDDTTEISFFDLIELRVVKAFRGAGISLQSIRYAIDFAQDKYGVEHPLSSLRFKTDGREILMEALEQDGNYVSLSKRQPGQKVFTEIVRQSLRDLEYDDQTVARWRPSIAKFVVIDPKRSFGDPILDEFGVSTEVLLREYNVFLSADYLSKIYEIPVKYVRDALAFERSLQEDSSSSESTI